jgi:hypothetical protein
VDEVREQRSRARRTVKKGKPFLSLSLFLSSSRISSHLEHETVLPGEHGPDEHRVEDLVVLLGLGGADVGQLPLEVFFFFGKGERSR